MCVWVFPPSSPAAAISEGDHASNRFAFVHQVKGVVDFFERHNVSDQIVDVDAAIHVPVDNFRNVATSARAAERGSFPGAAGHELERTRRDLLARAGDTDDNAG